MTGLLVKDLRIILQRKQALILFVLIALFFGFTMEGTFILGYLPFLFVVLAVGTISYDEVDNGYAFLMTLPIDAKTYVKEKYVFCCAFDVVAWIVAVILYLVANVIHGNPIQISEDASVMITFMLIGIVVFSIMIPIQLKYGMEKSRIATMVVAGSIGAIAFFVAKVLSVEQLNSISSIIGSMHPFILCLICMGVTGIIGFVSYLVSIKVMIAKEF